MDPLFLARQLARLHRSTEFLIILFRYRAPRDHGRHLIRGKSSGLTAGRGGHARGWSQRLRHAEKKTLPKSSAITLKTGTRRGCAASKLPAKLFERTSKQTARLTSRVACSNRLRRRSPRPWRAAPTPPSRLPGTLGHTCHGAAPTPSHAPSLPRRVPLA